MAKRWGATKAEWKRFKELAADDLLPVVSDPDAPIAPYSTMKQTGKTPSQYNDRGEVMGIAKWTDRTAHPKSIAAWSEEPNYGICVQTRHVRALDIDIDDPDLVHEIVEFIEDWFEVPQAIRYRSNSAKRLIPLIIPGKFGKRVMRFADDKGMVEFLATGQQFVAAGTHPSGVKYKWNEAEIQEITEDEFEDLWFAMQENFDTEVTQRGIREYVDTGKHTDETAKYLIEQGYVHADGNDGQLFLECPFSDEHSTESNGTDFAYFPAGSGGYDRGHFVCLHASCSHRTDDDYLRAFGILEADFEVVPVTEEEKALERPAYECDKHGRPKATAGNLKLALERPDICGYLICYDVFTDNIIFRKDDNWKIANDNLIFGLRLRLENNQGFHAIGKETLRDCVAWIADRNSVDTATEWLNAQEWDGKPRIKTFLSKYLGCEDNAYTRAVSMYLWTGLAGRVLVPALKCDMIPVLKSPEGYRKSSAVEAIAPAPQQFTEIDFSERDADIARRIRGKVIGEIAELRGLRTREMEGILAFVTRRYEEWVPKYREFAISFPRRLMFIATTNEDQFLDGVRAHRRWLPLEVKEFADIDAIVRDRGQLWAEAREVFKETGLQYQTADTLAATHREEYRIKDAWEDVIEDWLFSPDDLDDNTPADKDYIKLVDVARFALSLDPAKLKRADEIKLGNCLKALGFEPARVWDGKAGKQIRAWKKKEGGQ